MSRAELVVSVVGARPQFIKAAVVSRSLEEAGVEEALIHTGQHYDHGMSDVFFEELSIRKPAANLGIGSGSHGRQTGEMLAALEAQFVARHPGLVLIYGDTNSTLAAALAAAKLHIPVAHVEAGLRSFNMLMPEEINRILSDKISTLLLCPTETAVDNLSREGITEGVSMVGDVMYDAALFYSRQAPALDDTAAGEFGAKRFYLATVHRAENTDDPARLESIFSALAGLDLPVVMPLHPRTAKTLEERGITPSGAVRIIAPVGYLEMVALERAAALVLTDSGGMQKEAYFHGTPCVTLRDETEWVETVEAGWNVLAGADADGIAQAVSDFGANPPSGAGELFGDGHAGEKTAAILLDHLTRTKGA